VLQFGEWFNSKKKRNRNMAILSLLNQASGPLPLYAKFDAPSDAQSCVVLSGSVWSQTANQMIGIAVELDGVPIGSASIFSNASGTHRTVVTAHIPVKLTFGAHAISILPTNTATTSDQNDVFNLVLQY
jgi:hypothetical protein